MPNETVALDGELYASDGSGIMNTSDFLLAEFRNGATMEHTEGYTQWRGQSIALKGITLTKTDFRLTIAEMAFKGDTLADLLGIEPERLASRKRVTAISAGGTEATLTTEPETDEAFEDNEQVLVVDESGLFYEGYVDNNLSDTELDVDDGANAAVANIADTGVMADLDYTDPQYLTRADDVLLDIGDGQDYSVSITFKRRREGVTEVLMGKTADYDGTAYGTTAGWVLYIDVFNVLHFAVNDGVDAYIINGTTPILKDELHHVAVTYDENSAGACLIYLNGYDDTTDKTGTLSAIGDCSNAGVFSIGAESDGGTPYDGYILDATVFDNIVRSAADQLAHASVPRAQSGTPTAWWPFTDGTGSNTCDDESSAANQFDLTLVGGTTTNYGTWGRDQIAVVTANLLGFDHGMENAGIGGWTAGDAGTSLGKNTQYVKFGARSLRITNGDGTQAYVTHDITTITGVEYTFHGWFRAPMTPSGAAQLVDIDTTAALGITVTQAAATTARTWYEIYFTFEAADTTTTVDLGSGSTTSGEIAYWDNIQVFKNYVDTGGFETNIAGSDWATTGAPTVDDADTTEDTGTLCYKINSDTPASKYVSQAVTITSGEEYTFTGRVKAGTADQAVVVLSGAASVTLDNGAETTNWVTVRHRFTAVSGSLVIKIYGDGVDARFDNFSVIKVDVREYYFDTRVNMPTIQFMLQFLDTAGKKHQLFYDEAKVIMQPINFTNEDYVVHGVEVIPLNDFIHLIEN